MSTETHGIARSSWTVCRDLALRVRIAARASRFWLVCLIVPMAAGTALSHLTGRGDPRIDQIIAGIVVLGALGIVGAVGDTLTRASIEQECPTCGQPYAQVVEDIEGRGRCAHCLPRWGLRHPASG